MLFHICIYFSIVFGNCALVFIYIHLAHVKWAAKITTVTKILENLQQCWTVAKNDCHRGSLYGLWPNTSFEQW